MGGQSSTLPAEHVPAAERYSATFLRHVHASTVAYDFRIDPPSRMTAPSRTIQRTYEEFQELHSAVVGMHGERAPDLPPSRFFPSQNPEFLAERARALQLYLESLLALELVPRSRALRRFLGISARPPVPRAVPFALAHAGPMTLAGHRIPIGVFSVVLSFGHPRWNLAVCAAVSRGAYAASRSARCWPSLKFSSSQAEYRLPLLFSILVPASQGLQTLSLSLAFGNRNLGQALPEGLQLPQLRRLSLRLHDAEAVALGTEILEHVPAQIQYLTLEAVVSEELISALVGAVSEHLLSLSITCLPLVTEPVINLDESCGVLLMHVLEASPSLQRLSLTALGPRKLQPLQPPFVEIPNTQPFLANTAILARLQDLHFDFLSDEAVPCLRLLDERSLCLRRVAIRASKRQLEDPEDAFLALLRCLGDGLEHFSFHVDIEPEMRDFLQGFLRTRLGATPAQFRNRGALVSLVTNWPAFDDDAIRCIIENCPRLQTLLLDRCEYWTDAAVNDLTENLPELRYLRLRQSPMLSDRALFALTEVADRMQMVEIEPSYSMSSQMLDQLQHRLSPGAEPLTQGFLNVNPTSLMAAVVGEQVPAGQANQGQPGFGRPGFRPGLLPPQRLVILPEYDVDLPSLVPEADDLAWA